MPSAVGPDEDGHPDEPDRDADDRASRGSRSPKKSRPKMATQTGSIAIRSAVIPDGIVCSPKATMPIPPPSRRPPTMSESRHSRRVGHVEVAARRAGATRRAGARPRVTNRVAAIRNGGMLSTATAIAR